MGLTPFLFIPLLLFTFLTSSTVCEVSELKALMDLKASLDPKNAFLGSWTGLDDPCGGTYEGVACNEKGQIVNISLQGKGLSGKLSTAIGELRHLTGLYLHYNSLYGEIPKEISSLSELSDLYLNVNNLSGEIPEEVGNMVNLQVLQLCYNQLTGSIPTQVGDLKKLSVLALQSNQLTGAIPASLGDLVSLRRLDLSFNSLFGSIPTKLADAPVLEVLDVRNNMLSGSVPLALKRLVAGFQYDNNHGLCGNGFASLRACNALDHRNPNQPEPYGEGSTGFSTKDIPETANLRLNCSGTCSSHSSKASQASVVVGVVIIAVIVSAIGVLTFTQYWRRKQKLESAFEISESRPSLDQAKEVCKKNGSPLISLEYSSGWDPLAEGRCFGGVCQEVMQTFRLNLEEVESATRYFADKNLLGKSNFSATYKGVLRDGTLVAVKRITKSSCRSEEAEFLKGLNVLTSLRHENVVRLRGFCSSRGRGECFLVYDFVPNGNLSRYLDVEGAVQVLEWSTRVKIINGIAKGIGYLHECRVNKPALIHQNISAENVLIDQRFKPLLSDSGLHKLVTNDTVFSRLKASAARGYLAPEYTTTGRFTEKSDIYAFGVLVFQILHGKRKFTSSMRAAAEICRFHEFIDPNLDGKFTEPEAAKLAKVALMCTHESPEDRPSMEILVQELGNCTN